MVAKISASQCRMARAGLGIGVRELATAAKVSTNTITRLEAGEELKERTVDAVCATLESLGAEFTNGETPGVKIAIGLKAKK